MKILLIKSIL